MHPTRRLFTLSALLACLLLHGCGGGSGSSTLVDAATSGTTDTTGTATEATTTVDTSPYAISVASSSATYNADDVVTGIPFDYTLYLDLTAETVRLSTDAAAQAVTTAGATALTVGATTVTVTKTANGITIASTVAAKVAYVLAGSLAGTLTVSSADVYELRLDGVAIHGAAGPALDLESTKKVFIVTTAGTTSTLSDPSTRTLTMKACLYGKGPMVFAGTGTLSVTGVYKHGIFSNDYIRVTGGTLIVNVSAKDAVRSVNGFIFDDGDLTIHATGTAIDDESKGIKVEGAESASGAGKGFVVVNGGRITVTSVSKAITAGWDIDEDATTAATTDDPNPYVEINNGILTLTTTGTSYEYVSGSATVSCSPEGIEAKSTLTVNNGHLTVVTTDDALNGIKSIVINDGRIYAESSTNDAIDSNGTLTIAGGIVVAVGAGAPEAAFDCDWNTFAVTGGTFVGIGGDLSTPTASVCTQNAVILGSGAKSGSIGLSAADGTVVFSFAIPKSYGKLFLSNPNLATGTKYTVLTGGTPSGEKSFHGLYLGNLSYLNGTAGKSFTISSVISNLGF